MPFDKFDKNSDNALLQLVKPIEGGQAANISATDHEFAQTTRRIYVGTKGNLVLTLKDGNNVTYTNVQDGTFIAVRATHVVRTGTTASNIVGEW